MRPHPAAILGLLLLARSLSAQTPHQASALRGLRAVRVTLNFQGASAERAGAIDTALLRAQVEIEVRAAGLTTTAPGPSTAQLALSVTLLSRPESACRPDSILHWYSYRLELRQWAMIERQPPSYVWATTWGLGGVGFSNESHIATEVVLSVHQLTQTFVNEYRADNAARP